MSNKYKIILKIVNNGIKIIDKKNISEENKTNLIKNINEIMKILKEIL